MRGRKRPNALRFFPMWQEADNQQHHAGDNQDERPDLIPLDIAEQREIPVLRKRPVRVGGEDQPQDEQQHTEDAKTEDQRTWACLQTLNAVPKALQFSPQPADTLREGELREQSDC